MISGEFQTLASPRKTKTVLRRRISNILFHERVAKLVRTSNIVYILQHSAIDRVLQQQRYYGDLRKFHKMLEKTKSVQQKLSTRAVFGDGTPRTGRPVPVVQCLRGVCRPRRACGGDGSMRRRIRVRGRRRRRTVRGRTKRAPNEGNRGNASPSSRKPATIRGARKPGAAAALGRLVNRCRCRPERGTCVRRRGRT